MIPASVKDEVVRLRGLGLTRRQIERELGLTSGQVSGLITRGNLHFPAKPDQVRGLPADHPAVVEGRTLFPTRVRTLTGPIPEDKNLQSGKRVLMSGANQVKLGAKVTKGAWRGMPILTVTLEERATCPRSCHVWRECYGNGSHHSWRNKAGPEFELRLWKELWNLQTQFPYGFVVRLHLLGDFYSVNYVYLWERALIFFPTLHVFGYTAWGPGTEIGDAVNTLSRNNWRRFAIRQSSPNPGPRRAFTLRSTKDAQDLSPDVGVVCPAQTGKTKSCGTCGLCWNPAFKNKAIGFLLHGR